MLKMHCSICFLLTCSTKFKKTPAKNNKTNNLPQRQNQEGFILVSSAVQILFTLEINTCYVLVQKLRIFLCPFIGDCN